MRILHFVSRPRSPDTPGSSRGTQFAAHWARAGHQVTVIAPAPPRPGISRSLIRTSREGGVRILEVWLPCRNPERGPCSIAFAALALIASVARVRSADVVLAGAEPLPLAWACLARAAAGRSALVIECDPPPVKLPPGRIARARPTGRALGLLARRASRLVVPDSVAARRIVALAGGRERAAPVTIVPEALDARALEAPDTPPDGGQRTAGTVFCPLLGGDEGVSGAALDVALLLRSRSAVRFELLGPAGSAEALRRRATLHGAGNVGFGPQPGDLELFEVLRRDAAAVLVVAPPRDTGGDAIRWVVSAMAAGVPVVVCGRGRAARLVERARCGEAVRRDDPGALARTLTALIDAAPHGSAKVGGAGRRYLLDRRQGGDIASRMLEALQSAAGFVGAGPTAAPRSFRREALR